MEFIYTNIVTIKIAAVAVILTIVLAIVAVAMDTQNAAAQSRYLAPSFNTSIVKHADADTNERMDIAFGSDDAAYRSHSDSTPSTFGALFTPTAPVMPTTAPVSLPGTSAPHGSVTCNVSDGHGNTFQVTRDSCDDL